MVGCVSLRRGRTSQRLPFTASSTSRSSARMFGVLSPVCCESVRVQLRPLAAPVSQRDSTCRQSTVSTSCICYCHFPSYARHQKHMVRCVFPCSSWRESRRVGVLQGAYCGPVIVDKGEIGFLERSGPLAPTSEIVALEAMFTVPRSAEVCLPLRVCCRTAGLRNMQSRAA